MALLPIYKDEMLFDGSFIHALPFCLKNCKNDKCLVQAATGANKRLYRNSGLHCAGRFS